MQTYCDTFQILFTKINYVFRFAQVKISHLIFVDLNERRENNNKQLQAKHTTRQSSFVSRIENEKRKRQHHEIEFFFANSHKKYDFHCILAAPITVDKQHSLNRHAKTQKMNAIENKNKTRREKMK